MEDPFLGLAAEFHGIVVGADSSVENASTQGKIDRIVERAAEVLQINLGVEKRLITVRLSSGYKKSFLKPVYAFPDASRNYFFDRAAWSQFLFDLKAFKPLPVIRSDRPSTTVMQVYDLEGIDGAEDTFSRRIKNLLEEAAEEPSRFGLDAAKVRELRGPKGVCYVFGRLGNRSKKSDQIIDRLIAFYAVSKEASPEFLRASLKSYKEPIAALIELVFASLEEIEYRDRAELKSEALARLSALIPAFSSPETSPADAVAGLLGTFQELLSEHSVGPPSDNETPTTRQNSRDCWANFVTVQFQQDVDNKALFPTFEVYPRHLVDENVINAFAISHKEMISTVKYLVYLWSQNQSALKISPRFSKLFDHKTLRQLKKEPQGVAYRPTKTLADSTVRAIVLTEHDNRPVWDVLNVDVAPRGPQATLTTAAFLLFRQEHDNNSGESREIPYAVLAFESGHPDAFSDLELELLSDLVRACAPLVANLKMGSSKYDYRSIVRRAYGNWGDRLIGDSSIRFSEFLFECLRIDKSALAALLATEENSPFWRLPGALSREEAFKLVADPLKEMPEEPIPRQGWLTENEEMLIGIWSQSADAVDSFLSAVPSNLVWHCYLRSIPRALAERGFSEQPTFQLFQTGFSALHMFVAGPPGVNEIRQVIKLSTKTKISDERDRYKEYVRYRIPLAARLPASGYAFETTGNPETRPGSDGFGVLVSDLIGTGSKTTSLMDECVALVTGEKESLGWALLADALRHHFEKNTSLWDLRGEYLSRRYPRNSATDVVQTIARLRRETTADAPSTIASLTRRADDLDARNEALAESIVVVLQDLPQARLPRPHASGHRVSLRGFIDELYKDWSSRTEKDEFFPPLDSIPSIIIHGDLHGHNLTWAEEYQKLFMIDFEHVRHGFRGADQFKLVTSMISDLVWTARRKKNETDPAKLILLHNANLRMIDFLKELRNSLANTDTTAKFLAGTKPSDGIVFLASRILQTIDFKEIGSPWDPKAASTFWRYVLRAFALKQFEYSFRALDLSYESDIRHLRATRTDGGDFVGLMKKPETAGLIYSYLAVDASLTPPVKTG